MDNSNQFVLADHKQATIDLTNEIKNKLDYLQSLGRAVQALDDRLVYDQPKQIGLSYPSFSPRFINTVFIILFYR